MSVNRSLVVAVAIALGACTRYTEVPNAPQATSDRWHRIMDKMRADSADAAKHATRVEEKSSSNYSWGDGSMPAGIDINKFELPIQYNERVQSYIDLYANRRKSVFSAWYRRMGRYRGYIEDRLAAANLPRELVYLPLIESGYEPNASSSAAAVGIWQFMKGTAKAEGLEVNDYVDERRDPFKSTDAAIRHLKGLHSIFGSWYLSAAAYNSGSGRIARLLKEYGHSVKSPDETFWEMQDALPTETRGYVPGLVAATIIGEYPQLFGISQQMDAPVRFDVVRVTGLTDLADVAKAVNVPTQDIKELNPQYFRGITPPDRMSEVRVPIGSSDLFAANFKETPQTVQRVRSSGSQSLTSSRTHIVKKGETLSQIAQDYGVSLDALQKANRIKRPDMVGVGRKLIIPNDSPRSVYGTD